MRVAALLLALVLVVGCSDSIRNVHLSVRTDDSRALCGKTAATGALLPLPSIGDLVTALQGAPQEGEYRVRANVTERYRGGEYSVNGCIRTTDKRQWGAPEAWEKYD